MIETLTFWILFSILEITKVYHFSSNNKNNNNGL